MRRRFRGFARDVARTLAMADDPQHVGPLLLGGLGGVLFFIVALYSWYLLYLGAPVLRKASEDKAVVFTIAVAIVGLLIWYLLGRATLLGMPMPGAL